MVHFPHGSTVLAHALSPFNGFLGIFLLKFLTPIQTYNFIVVFGFVASGLTAFWLAYDVTKAYWPSLAGGYLFTFCNYHFAFAEGHLQLVSMEWVPLFILFWRQLIARPNILRALASAFTLFLVLLCNYYYFTFCVLAGILTYVWRAAWQKKPFYFLQSGYLKYSLVFLAATLSTSGVLAGLLIQTGLQDPLAGSHSTDGFSMDLLASTIPGNHWRFASLTRPYWSQLPENPHEHSVYLGLSVLLMLVLVWKQRRRIQDHDLGVWFFLALIFWLLALGPSLHVWGRTVPGISMPYLFFEFLFPPLKLSGTPVRMMVMVYLAAAVIFAVGLKHFYRRNGKDRNGMALLLLIFFIEYLPSPIPVIQIPVPGFVRYLQAQPGNGALIDLETKPAVLQMYYQTLHQKPMAFGKLSRTPASVVAKNKAIVDQLNANQFEALFREKNFKYLLVDKRADISAVAPSMKKVFRQPPYMFYFYGNAFNLIPNEANLYEFQDKGKSDP